MLGEAMILSAVLDGKSIVAAARQVVVTLPGEDALDY